MFALFSAFSSKAKKQKKKKKKKKIAKQTRKGSKGFKEANSVSLVGKRKIFLGDWICLLRGDFGYFWVKLSRIFELEGG